MGNVFSGRVWKFGDDINTDLLIPGFAIFMPLEEQIRHVMSANRPGWVDEVQLGDVLLAGSNFGVGSARSIGDVILGLGIVGVVAESFNGLGLRNCINVGLPVLPCNGILEAFEEGELAEVDWTNGAVTNVSRETSLRGEPLPMALQDIVQAGGVEAVLRSEGYLAQK